jgi:hypothetical protein
MSKSSRRRLVIIHHADEKLFPGRRHLLHLLIPLWREAGIEVLEVYGPGHAPDADVAFLHVDVTIMPPEYLEFARRYPVVINGGVPDILKTRLSQLRVTRESDYDGPVIMKSALNSAGQPERAIYNLYSLPRRILYRLLHPSPQPRYPVHLWNKSDYKVYPSIREVPGEVWDCPHLLVEKLVTEMHDGQYCLRECYFFGDQADECVELSPNPVFTSGELALHLQMGIPPELHALRKKLGFDYGKFDYVMIDGKPFVFDFNKTTGLVDPESDSSLGRARHLATGIDPFFA